MCLTKAVVWFEARRQKGVLTSQEVLEQVSKMQVGDRKRFVMRANDSVFKSGESVDLFVLSLRFIKGHTTHCRWNRIKNRVLFEVSIID